MVLYVAGLIIGYLILYIIPIIRRDVVDVKSEVVVPIKSEVVVDVKSEVVVDVKSEVVPIKYEVDVKSEVVQDLQIYPSNQEDTSIRSISEPTERKSSKRSKGEQATLTALYNITGKTFITIRPNFLKNPETGRNLELDCYNHDLKLAVEYNGIQHYNYPNFAYKTENDWIQQVRRDDFKRRSCDKHGIYLITVPHSVPNYKIEDYLRRLIPSHMISH
jgi:hypothetical protein